MNGYGLMKQYILQRIWHMIPIVFGVILLTFILFNVVGGSPASMVLGKNATAQALDEYDHRSGFDKPLFAGRYLATRLVPDAGVLQSRPTDRGEELQVPLQYNMPQDRRYQLRMQLSVEAENEQPVWLWLRDSNGAPAQHLLGTCTARAQWLEVDVSGADLPDSGMLELVSESSHFQVTQVEVRGISEQGWSSQFIDYLRRLAVLDMGVSTETGERVSVLLKRGVMPSLLLNVPILIGSVLLAVVMALLCAWQRDLLLDRAVVLTATLLMSVNYIVWIVVGQYVLSYRLGWFPIWGFESWRYLLLPVFIGVVTGLGRDVRYYRTFMLDEMYKDYVRTALAKGVSPAGILFKHVLRNAMVAVVTNVSLSLPFLFTGSLLLESFFGIPGLGGMSINAINSSDLAVVQAVVLIGSMLYVVVNVLTDICYVWVDPRIRLN